MAADDTSREALIESLRGPLANVLCNASNFPRRAQPHILGADMGPLMDATTESVVDAVVMPLVQERDAAIKRAEAAEAEVERLRILWDRSGKNDLIEQRDTYRERWRQLMRDHEAAVKERDELEAENERLRDTARNYEIAMHAARGERDELQAECLRVDEANTRLGEQVRKRDEVIEREAYQRGQVEAWERGYMFAFAQERGDHTHSRPVPDYLADDIRSWNPYLTPEQP